MSDDEQSSQSSTFTAADVALIEGLRAGYDDARIARDCARDAAWVQKRIVFLAGHLGVEGRAGLAAWQPAAARFAQPASNAAAPSGTLRPPRRFGRRAVLRAGGVAGAAAAVAGLYALLNKDPDEVAPAVRLESAPTVPPLEPTPIPATDVLGWITDASTLFEKLSFSPGAPIDAEQGIFFMDTASGAIEGWRLWPEVAAEFPGTYFYTPSQGNSLIALKIRTGSGPGREFLLDRATGKAYGWRPVELSLVAVLGELLFFEETGNLQGDTRKGRYYLVRRTSGGLKRVSSFQHEVVGLSDLPRTLLSPDGKTLFFTAWPVGRAPTLFKLDVATGETDAAFEAEDDQAGGRRASFRELRPSADGLGLVAIIDARLPESVAPPLRRAVAFTWEGKLRSAGTLTSAERAAVNSARAVSPGGKLALADAPVRLLPPSTTPAGGEYWPGASVVSSTTGSPLFRLRSASLGSFWGVFNPWLADSSGFIAWVLDDADFSGLASWQRQAPAIVSPDGSTVERLPMPPGPEPWILSDRVFGPIPAKDNPHLLSYSGVHLFNRRTRAWLSANLARQTQYINDPWAGGSGEMVFALPGGSIGLGSAPDSVLLPPSLEPAPFEEDLRFKLRAGLGDVPLFSAPEPSAERVANIAAGAELALAELPAGELPGDRRAMQFDRARGITWIRVAADAAEGWVDSARLDWA